MASSLPLPFLLDQKLISVSRRLDPRIGSHLSQHLRVQIEEDVLGSLIYELSAHVLAEKLVEKKLEQRVHMSVSYPANWWEHFRQEVFPRGHIGRWLLKRKPVLLKFEERHVTVRADFNQYALFPAADHISAPPHIHKRVFYIHEEASIR